MRKVSEREREERKTLAEHKSLVFTTKANSLRLFMLKSKSTPLTSIITQFRVFGYTVHKFVSGIYDLRERRRRGLLFSSFSDF